MAPKKLTTEEWIKVCQQVHKNPDGTPKYDYSITKYIDSTKDIEYICPIHGIRQQNAGHHKNGIGCKLCGIKSKISKTTKPSDKFIQEVKAIHDPLRDSLGLPRYDYSITKYIHSEKEIDFYCPVIDEKTGLPHGKQTVLACNHKQGSGCRFCGTNRQKEKCRKPVEQFIQESKAIHDPIRDSLGLPRYDYSKVVQFEKMTVIIDTIRCPIHGYFPIQPHHHLISKEGCQECSKELQAINATKTTEQFIQESKAIHDPIRDSLGLPRYDYSITKYIGAAEDVDIICPIHGKFTKRASKHLYESQGCEACSNTVSKIELELREFLKLNNIKFETNNRNIISPKEIDIFIPSHNIGIEIDGLRWHSDIYKDQNYHLHKTIDCEKQNIHLIHIFEDEWLEKSSIIKARLLNLLGKNKFSIGARKLILKQVSVEEERRFLQNHHIQGYVASQVCYGLYYQTKDNRELLVCLMSFGQLRKNLGSSAQDGVYELYRFVTAKHYSVPGGASRLFKHFVKQLKPKQVVSYADRRWSIKSERNLYEQLGFKFDSYTDPNYFYVQGTKRINRFALRKDVLIKEYGCLPTQTEKEFTEQMGWPRIYDVGNLKYVWQQVL